MADHLDAPNLMSPDGNPKTDITDIYAFQKPGDPRKSILILMGNGSPRCWRTGPA